MLPTNSHAIGEEPRRTSDPLRVMFVIGDFQNGGGERFLSDLTPALAERGLSISITCFSQIGGEHYRAQLPAAIRFYNLNVQPPIRRAIGYSLRSLKQVLQLEEPDVVVSLTNELTSLILAVRLWKHLRFRVIANVHIHLSASFETYSQIKRIITKALCGPVFTQCDSVVPVSNGVGSDLVTQFRVPCHKIHVIHNGIRGARLRALAQQPSKVIADIEAGQSLIIGVGRLIPQKGFEYLLRAFARIRALTDAHLLILGEGPLRKDLTSLAHTLDIATRVHLPGFLANPFPYIARTRVFVLSSLWEAFPYAVLEAMALSRPVVATTCPSGPDEIIKHGFSGLLVPPASVGALAEAILEVLKDDSLSDRLGSQAKVRSDDFALEGMVDRYADLFHEVRRTRK